LLLCILVILSAVGGARAYLESSNVSPAARARLQECTQRMFSGRAGGVGEKGGGGAPFASPPQEGGQQRSAWGAAPPYLLILIPLAGAIAAVNFGVAACSADGCLQWLLSLAPPAGSRTATKAGSQASFTWEARLLALCLALALGDFARRRWWVRHKAALHCSGLCPRRGGWAALPAAPPPSLAQPPLVLRPLASLPVAPLGSAAPPTPQPAHPSSPPPPQLQPQHVQGSAAAPASPPGQGGEESEGGTRAAAAALRAKERVERRQSLMERVAQQAHMQASMLVQEVPGIAAYIHDWHVSCFVLPWPHHPPNDELHLMLLRTANQEASASLRIVPYASPRRSEGPPSLLPPPHYITVKTVSPHSHTVLPNIPTPLFSPEVTVFFFIYRVIIKTRVTQKGGGGGVH